MITQFRTACAAVGLAALMAGPAAAQVAGVYSGNSADGNGLSFTVATDSNTGALAVTSALVFFTAPCKGSTFVLNTGWGWGPTSDIADHKVTSVTDGTYFNITFSLKFAADGQSATGTIVSVSPALDNSAGPAKKALFCTSPKQTLSLALQPPGAKPAAVPFGHALLDRSGQAIAATTR
jgi:hypothetical protein